MVESPNYKHIIERIVDEALNQIHNRSPEVCGYSSARLIVMKLEQAGILPELSHDEHDAPWHIDVDIVNCSTCREQAKQYMIH